MVSKSGANPTASQEVGQKAGQEAGREAGQELHQEPKLFELLNNAASDALRGFLQQLSLEAWGPGAPIETHISWVFLTPDRAFKLKKPVRLSFLDFSTLDRREQACRRELEVNRVFAPELYLGVQPIVASPDGALRLGPLLTTPSEPTPDIKEGAVLDWVVTMRRFDEEGEFDALAEKGALTQAMARRLADKVSSAHLRAHTGGASMSWRETLAQISGALSAAGLEAQTKPWRIRAAQELARVEPQLEARRRHGFFRRLHGDLHLGNICLLDGEPTLFDAIEFDDAIATIDPLYDAAFTAMDLLWRGAPDLAQVFLSRYLSATRDYGGLIGWPLFLSLRAAIRAMTAASKGDTARAEEKLNFATRLLSQTPEPKLYVVAGLSGGGKSTLAAAIAPDCGSGGALRGGAVTISSDVTRKRLFGEAPESPLPAAAYQQEVSAAVYRRMLKDAGRACRAGACVILDGVFARREERDAAQRLAEGLGIDFQGFWLETPLETRLERIERRAAAPLRDASDADAAVARAQTGAPPADEPCWRLIPTDGGAKATETAVRALLGLPLSPDDD